MSSGTAQQASPVKVTKVKGNIYEAKGGRGANCGFYIGENEVLVIDAKSNTETVQAMIAEIKKITSLPIKYVVLTHSDGDHIGGLPGFPGTVNIIAHDQTREDVAKAFKDPKQKLYIPNMSFSDKFNLSLGKKTIKLFHFGPAHTSGDTVVYFPDEKVTFLGDLLFLGRDPLIHRHKNGTSFGLVKNLAAILKLDADTFVHGHGDIANRNDVKSLMNTIIEKQNKIKALFEEGKSLDEIKKVFNIEDRPGGSRWPTLVETIYLELTEKK